ncbi:hypothetical protein ACFC1B_13575 [Streptomyces xiamenensis]|uniref:hypothetical protein n=1 Tax=Streptomyces xiamenensis TaxID=408015 RepID=UPI000A628565|nr:hypothetical protein [Streptomyces xiamenensis]
MSEELRPSARIEAAGWIGPRLGGEFGAARRTVPGGFAAYARIFHPAGDHTWAEVAAATGRRAHPLMQWHALVGLPDPYSSRDPLWGGDRPELGLLEPDTFARLRTVLARHTGTADACWFGLWEGYGGVDIPPATPALPLVELPGRAHLLLSGALEAAWPHWFAGQSPNLYWPQDRAWCAASEIDFDSTLVAGSPALIGELLRAPGLEVAAIGPDDSLAVDADRVNAPPGSGGSPDAGTRGRSWPRWWRSR